MPTIKFVNAETGAEIEREMNAEELAQHNKDIENIKIEREKEQLEKIKRQNILDKLNLTNDEAKLLFNI